MAITRILDKVYREPWLIKPSAHQSICATLSNYIASGADYDADDDYEEFELKVGTTQVIPIHGIIGKHLSLLETSCGGVDVDTIAMKLDAALADDSIDSIVLYINSAGGTVTGVPELAEHIARVADEKQVVAYTDSLCASAAYWLASSCNAVWASRSSEVGSIGVYMTLLNESDKLAKEGVRVEAFQAGDYKLAGASFKPLTQDERELFQQDVDYWYKLFTEHVTSKRPLSTDVMQGQTFVGEKALELNLVDGIVDDLADVLAMTLDNR